MHKQKLDRSTPADLDQWKPLEDFLKSHPQFNKAQMRWLLRNRNRNGLQYAVRRIGRNIYLHEGMFANWILEQKA